MLLFCVYGSVDSPLTTISQPYGYKFYHLLKLFPAINYSSTPTHRTLIIVANSPAVSGRQDDGSSGM